MRTMILRVLAACLFLGPMIGRAYATVDDRGQLGAVCSELNANEAGLVSTASQKTSPVPATTYVHQPEEGPEYWHDRGGLQSAYGAYEAAANSYCKAIAMAPHDADAYFQLGVAYGELHRFEAAIRATTQAILLDAGESAYYYGRGRVYLLMGAEDLAMRDFMEAGFRGHPDARAYLKDAGVSLESTRLFRSIRN